MATNEHYEKIGWWPTEGLTEEEVHAVNESFVQLEFLFRRRDFKDNPQLHDEAMTIFAKYPRLVRGETGTYYDSARADMLTIMVAAGASVHVLENIVSIFPAVAIDEYSVLEAYDNGVRAESMFFLLKEVPQMASSAFIWNLTTDEQYSAEEKKALMQAFPGCHKSCLRPGGRSVEPCDKYYFPLSHSLNELDLLDYMVDSFPRDQKVFGFGVGGFDADSEDGFQWIDPGEAPINAAAIEKVARIFPQLNELIITFAERWKADAIACFWNQFQGLSTNLKVLRLAFFYFAIFEETNWTDQLLSTMAGSLAMNKSIHTMLLE